MNFINHPLCHERFLKLLDESAVVGNNSGWLSQHQKYNHAILPGFIKSHSYGEYIFDWQWANFYHSYQKAYYPKLIHALPFTPVNAPKIWNANDHEFIKLIDQSFSFYQNQPELTGEHYLFIDEKLAKMLQEREFCEMYSLQYHWHLQNQWRDFHDYLDSLKANRKKMIKKERKKVTDYNLKIEWKNGTSLPSEKMREIYQLYLATIEKKNSYAYLNQKFFELLPSFLSKELLVIEARLGEKLIAMALYFKGESALYGRYWGILPEYEEQFPMLHFELCYYQGIELCLKERLPLFEAGAQGEHKIWRGFHPKLIRSAHHLKNKEFFQVIKNHIKAVNQEQLVVLEKLKELLPFGS